MSIGTIFSTVFFNPVVNLLAFIYFGLSSIGLPGALGFSIILLTIIIRLVVWPFMSTQIKSSKKMAELKPHLDALKEKHKDDKQALAAAQMALYKEHNINPAGGCLPAIVQIPIIWALYNTILSFFANNGIEKINGALYPFVPQINGSPDLNFLGISLASKPGELGIAFMILIPLLTAGLQFIQSKMMMPKVVKKYPGDSKKEKEEKASSEDAMASIQTQMVFMMPLMVGYFALQFPIGIALYWNTFTILGIIQQYLLSGLGGVEGWLKIIKR